MIVFAIKSFFSKVNIYNFEWKSYTSYFFGKITRIIYTILAITINNLEMHLGNLNLLSGKSTIWFELSIQKEEINKQITGILFYQY